MRLRQGICFSVLSVEPLHSAGRLSMLPQSVSTTINRLPVLTIRDGAIACAAVARGTDVAAHEMVKQVPAGADDLTLAARGPLVVELFRATREAFPQARVKDGGPVLSCNLGAGAASISWAPVPTEARQSSDRHPRAIAWSAAQSPRRLGRGMPPLWQYPNPQRKDIPWKHQTPQRQARTSGSSGLATWPRRWPRASWPSGRFRPSHICACARNWDKLCANAARIGVTARRSASEVVEASDVVVIAVRPYQVADVVAPIREALAGKVVVSVAAGVPFSAYEGILAPGTHHMSCVPNTPVSVGKGVFVCEATDSLTSEERALVDEIFSHVGIVERIDTAHMGVAGTVAGCGPAWVCMLIEALGDAGVKHGLTRAQAYRLAGQMVAGTGEMLVASGEHPAALKDAVCSPGGTAIAGAWPHWSARVCVPPPSSTPWTRWRATSASASKARPPASNLGRARQGPARGPFVRAPLCSYRARRNHGSTRSVPAAA